MTRKTSLIPTEGILTKEGLQPASYNIDSYVSMMESVAHGAKGAAGMGSPTANR
ncbi:portal protein, partial [Salmonella enterica subsp. enterica serovar Stanley]|nr:portal protein [Salmonella enterica subsp. enterica serovar Stanley]